jgi:hypothetical protein
MEFAVDREKAVEALVYIASKVPGVGPFHAAKILYFAELEHLRTYGRPIVGDRYIAMEYGPVPSFARDALRRKVSPQERVLIENALIEKNSASHPTYEAARAADLSYFSASDLECLDRGIEHCAKRTFGAISDETHKHPAWVKAPLNGTMSYDDMIEGAAPEVIEDAEEFAAYGVL